MSVIIEFVNSSLEYKLESIPRSLHDAYFLFEAVSFFFAFFGFFLSATLFYIFVKVPQFHSNMIILMSNAILNFTIMTLCRLILVYFIWNCPNHDKCKLGYNSNPWMVYIQIHWKFLGYYSQLFLLSHAYMVDEIRYVTMFAYVFIVNYVIGERVWATIYVKVYERKRATKFIVTSFILHWVVSAGGVYLFLCGYLPVILICVLSIALCIALNIVRQLFF